MYCSASAKDWVAKLVAGQPEVLRSGKEMHRLASAIATDPRGDRVDALRKHVGINDYSPAWAWSKVPLIKRLAVDFMVSETSRYCREV